MHISFRSDSVKGREFRRPMRRWEDNIRMDLRGIVCEIDWIHLAQDWDQWRALVTTVMNLKVS
jgi:hypothetical protein